MKESNTKPTTHKSGCKSTMTGCATEKPKVKSSTTTGKSGVKTENKKTGK